MILVRRRRLTEYCAEASYVPVVTIFSIIMHAGGHRRECFAVRLYGPGNAATDASSPVAPGIK